MSANLHAPLSAAALLDGLIVQRAGRRVICLDETGSTNDEAFALAARDGEAADGTVIFAERQTAGRGRMGRRWLSPRGAGIACSLVLTNAARDSQPLMSLAAGVAACEAIESASEVRPNLRWPNDLFARGRKLGGVLVERKTVIARLLQSRDRKGAGSVPLDKDYTSECPPPSDGRQSELQEMSQTNSKDDRAIAVTVVGIGINCLQQLAHFLPELSDRATSLEMESSAPINRLAVARALIAAMDRWLASAIDAPRSMAEWARRSDDVGTRVTLLSRGETYIGRILTVAPDAGLLFETDAGERMECNAATTTIMERFP